MRLHSIRCCVSMPRMRQFLKSFCGFAAVIAAAFAPLSASSAAQVKDARVWAGPDYTRIVIDAKGPLDYKVHQENDKVVVDLVDSELADGFAEPAAQGLYGGLSHTRQGTRLRLTAKVAGGSTLKSFVLKPRSGSNYRLVMDLYPDGNGHATAVSAPTHETTEPQPRHESRTGRVAAQQAAAMLGAQRTVVVCIDAGHGGKDSGAIGPDGTMEKNVTLAVARDLAKKIDAQPGMRAVLTRKGDYFVPLARRYQIARQNNADLFVSIHADSFTSDDAKGSSVWVLSPRGKTNMAARLLADGQNRVDLIGGTSLNGMDDSLAKVVLDLQQGWAIQSSDVVAGNVLKALAKIGPTHRGYVEHANFVVLRSPDVPSILVETAFISNPTEERKLRNPGHQEKLAQAVMTGVKSYFEAAPPQGTWFAAQAAHRRGVTPASMLASNTSTTTASHGQDRHRVSRGESLGSIARQYGVSVGALKSANQMSTNSVQAGSVLTIPTS